MTGAALVNIGVKAHATSAFDSREREELLRLLKRSITPETPMPAHPWEVAGLMVVRCSTAASC